MTPEPVQKTTTVDKGKARARPELSENTPLLGSSSRPATPRDDLETSSHPQPLRSKLLNVFLASLSICVLLSLLLILIAWSYRSRAATISPEEILQKALVVRGPDRVNVLNTTGDGGIWIRVNGRIGFDAGKAVGIDRRAEDGWLEDMWKSIGRWGIRRLDRVSVSTTTITVSQETNSSNVLATITAAPMEIALSTNPPPGTSWLTPMSLPVLIRPTKDVSTLLRFIEDSWKEGTISVKASLDQVLIEGGGLRGADWRRALKIVQSNLHVPVHIKIPTIPGLPAPGGDDALPDLSKLVTLQSFRITSRSNQLLIDANATVLNPAPPNSNFVAPALPFTVSLAPVRNGTDTIPSIAVASVYTQSFSLTHPNITLTINGTVLPIAKSASGALSAFLGNYVSAIDSDIILSSPILPGFSVNSTFPAPHPKPQILRNVTINDMKIKPTGSTMAASGTVLAQVVLPKGIEVGLDVVRVFPDVLVYDGEVPDSDEAPESAWAAYQLVGGHLDSDEPPARPLPDPLPERAFAHIRPDDWLPSESEPVETDDDSVGSVFAVSAKIVDVPLEVLPGREREFSNFVSKVVFNAHGALAGVQGTAAVAVRVHGLPFENGHDGEMELTGLPFQGSVVIGKRNMLEDA
ncbi:hypothetical protein CERSUDRAFT_114648 [Gelatoporia subvermispora B]|uniref:Uncharacterized protein n=1 Tax=Ceriporiopsis subvermispora (strain B) TaxID=914234 RepID=M2RE55_CERS8|nr:hypothetical protein CERSUDRAFT_114648 [Gelatoporia subvermispora B]